MFYFQLKRYMYLVDQKENLLANKVHVLCQLEGKPSGQQGNFILLAGRSSFQLTRYMYLVDWKVFLPVMCLVNWKENLLVDKVHAPCWSEGFPSG
jgi:hypothetical protein